jgi:hypothetical protein
MITRWRAFWPVALYLTVALALCFGTLIVMALLSDASPMMSVSAASPQGTILPGTLSVQNRTTVQ